VEWLRSLGLPVLVGDPARGFLDTSGLTRLAAYRAHADGDTAGASLRDAHVYRCDQARAACRSCTESSVHFFPTSGDSLAFHSPPRSTSEATMESRK